VERAVVLTRRPMVGLEDLPETVQAGTDGPSAAVRVGGNGQGRPGGANVYAPALEGDWTPTALERALEEPEKQIILAALRANNWNRQETARQLDINRTTLYKKIKQYGLEGSA
jgi:two-component system, NtrC family, response regulator AtoC